MKVSGVETATQLGDGTDCPLGESVVDAGDDLVVGEGPAERLACFRRLERTGDGHGDVAHDQAVAMVDHQVRVLLQFAHRRERQGGGDVRFTIFDQGAPRLRFDDDAQDDLIEMLALPPTPIPVVPLQNGPGFDVELDDAVRPGAEPLAAGLRPGMPPIAIDFVVLQRGHVDDRGAVGGGERRLEQRLRPPQIEDEGEPVGSADLSWVCEESPEHG